MTPRRGEFNTEATKARMRQAKAGERHPQALAVDAFRIQQMAAAGMYQREIAAELGLSKTVVGDVLRGRHWTTRGAEK